MSFRVEYVKRRFLGREAAERATKSREVRRVLKKQDEGLFRKSKASPDFWWEAPFQLSSLAFVIVVYSFVLRCLL